MGNRLGAAHGLNKSVIARALSEQGPLLEFPSEMELPVEGKPTRVIVQYSFDTELQAHMEKMFKSYHPDFGAFVAVDAETGRILSLVSFAPNQKEGSANLALRATFPSASVFKVVTAAAAMSDGKLSPDSMLSYNGRNHTLYRSSVLKNNVNRWTRFITLKDAFAKSVNSVFGRLGAYTVGAEGMRTYADRFGFNRRIAADLPIQEGRAPIPTDPWQLAETSSGFTRDNTMSPLQGALIAAAVVNGGVMMEPYVVSSLHSLDGTPLYSAEPMEASHPVDRATAGEIRELMRQTVAHGTSRKSFRGFFRGEFSNLDVGGKTGSLTGTDPRGKYDWFVGFADAGGRKIAVAAITINQNVWRVKSSYLARLAFERFYASPKGEGIARPTRHHHRLRGRRVAALFHRPSAAVATPE